MNLRGGEDSSPGDWWWLGGVSWGCQWCSMVHTGVGCYLGYGCSVVQSCLTVTPWTATRQAPLFITNSQEFTQTHVHWVDDAIEPSHPLSLPSLALNLSQRQGLFASYGQSIGDLASASVLPMSIQGWFPLGLTGLISLLSKGCSRVFSNTMITCVSLLYSPSWTLSICVLSCKFYFNRMFAFTNDCEQSSYL